MPPAEQAARIAVLRGGGKSSDRYRSADDAKRDRFSAVAPWRRIGETPSFRRQLRSRDDLARTGVGVEARTLAGPTRQDPSSTAAVRRDNGCSARPRDRQDAIIPATLTLCRRHRAASFRAAGQERLFDEVMARPLRSRAPPAPPVWRTPDSSRAADRRRTAASL